MSVILGSSYKLSHAVAKQLPVCQSCEDIVVRQVVKLLLLVDMVDCECNVASEICQQLQLFFLKKLYLACVNDENTDSFISDYQRENCD